MLGVLGRGSSRWTTLCILLGFTFRGAEFRGPSPLDTLQCYNDYKTLITCSWQESLAARHFLKLRLHHWQNLNPLANRTCDPRGPGRDLGSYVALSCHPEAKTFGWTMKDFFTFSPEMTLEAHLSIKPWESDYILRSPSATDGVLHSPSVRPLPPQELRIQAMDGGDFLLSWKTPYQGNRSRMTPEDLEHELQYRRHWEHWEDSQSLQVPNGTHYTMRSGKLVPGSTYVARIHARPREEGALHRAWSDWSTELSWKVPEVIAAAPKNLQCSFNGADRMTCTWEVRAEVTESVTFIMYYRDSTEVSEAECHPTQWKDVPGVPIRFYSCEVPVSNLQASSQFQVSVRPETKNRSIEQCMNIQPFPPGDLMVDTQDPEVYHLSWAPKPLGYDIAQRYQFCYRKKKEDEDEGFAEFSLDCPPPSRLVNISNGPPSLSFNLMTQLDPLSQYTARVRARVTSDKPDSCYYGPWSEWSEPVTWETGSVWNKQMLLLLVPVLLILLTVGAVYSYGYLKRSHQQWKEKIPNPSKSILLASLMQKGSLALQASLRGLDIDRSGPSATEDPRNCTLMLEGKATPDLVGIIHKMETPFPVALDLRETSGPSAQTPPMSTSLLRSSSGHSWGYQPFPTLGAVSKSRQASAFSDTASSCSDFNGPYLLFLHGSGQSDDLTAPWSGKEEVPRGSPGYITLPPSADTQMLPDNPDAAPVLFSYILCPPEADAVSDFTEPKTLDEECWKFKCQAEEDAYQKCPILTKCASSDDQTVLSSVEEAPPVVVPVDYVMTPPNLLQLDFDLPTPPSFYQPQEEPSMDPDPHEGLILATAKQAGSLSGSYVVAPTETSRITTATAPLPGSTNGTGELLADRLVIFSPDGVSPVLLQQFGDYCFFPGSSTDGPAMGSCDRQKVPSVETDQKPSLSLGTNQSGGAPPHVKAIQSFKVMRNDYMALA